MLWYKWEENNPSYWIYVYQKVPIEGLWPFKLDISICAYWKVLTLHIRYTKRCLLKYHNPSYLSVYIKKIQKVSYCFFSCKKYPKLINQQLKKGVKIVNWQKKVSYCFFYCKKYPYLKLKNEIKIINWQK